MAKISLNQIEKNLIASDSGGSANNFAAAAVQINEAGEATHAGIIIKHQEEYYLFHFNGALALEDTPVGQWYFHKNFIFVKDGITGMFLAHCKNILKGAKPKYGYFFPGSYYDETGKYFSEINMPEYMTCVGF